MEVQGRVKMVGDIQTFGSNGFQKREIVVTTEEQYPQHIIIEFIQDKCSLLDNIQIGQLVKISINLRGREWISPQGETKYFNTLQGWRIETVQIQPVSNQGGSTPPPMPPMPPSQSFETTNDVQEGDDDDLPF